MERDDEIEKISKELEDILRMTSEKKRSSGETETEKKNLIPRRMGRTKKNRPLPWRIFHLYWTWAKAIRCRRIL
ncbi:hypothetical protein DW841_20995 [Hungatella hathewayi]|nr:hypothetical protein DW841_20995 [Hungatella hathewayi]